MSRPVLDHLVYATPDVDATIEGLELRLGVRATPGGSHPGFGTRNAIIGLGPGSYLEILGPDLEQTGPVTSPLVDLGALEAPRLVTWACRADRLSERVAAARAAGYDPGEVASMRRRVPDGTTLSWQLTLAPTGPGDGVVPFLIDWGESAHPSTAAPGAIVLKSLMGRHPEPKRVSMMLEAIEVDLEVEPSAEPALVAMLDTPRGIVQLT